MYSIVKVRYTKLGVAAIAASMLAAACMFSQVVSAAEMPAAIAPAPAPAPSLSYRSVFSDYQKLENFNEPKATAWRSANEKVEKIGGWREYAKEAARADVAIPTAEPLPAPTSAKPAPAPHHQQGKKP